MLLNIDISRLNNGNGLVDITRLPKWHKACYVLCRTGKTARAKNFLILQCKQHLSSTSAPSRSMKTDSDDELAWFFCDDTTGNLTTVETVSLDSHVRQIAEVLRDTKLLAKLSGGDMLAIDAQYHSFKAFWQHSMAEEDLGKYSRMKHTTSYKPRRTCICRGSVLHKEIWPDTWRPKCLRNL